jgi:hypothetical protein
LPKNPEWKWSKKNLNGYLA